MDNAAVIQAQDLKHSYDGRRFALNGISFGIRRGEVFGLLGRNGAGKSTLIKAMTTLIRPTGGTLRIFGMDPVHSGQQIRARIGVVQQGESFDFTSVEGNFDIYGILWGVPRPERIARRERLIRDFGLAEFRRRRSFDLSGGQKRRVQVAREFMHDMDILFLDEPTVGLDVLMRRTLLDAVRAEARKGLTVVFTTHNLEEADYVCDRIAVVDQGKLLVLDEVENLKRLYGGKKTIDLTVGNGGAAQFYAALGQALGGTASIHVQGASAVLMTDAPKDTLGRIVELSQRLGVQLEWLSVRKNTLEDVFLRQVASREESNALA